MKSENKVWLITGASSGFGRALAEEVLARGERVIGAGRHVVALADLVARAPDRVAGIRLDVSRTEEIKPAVQAAIARFGQIDVLVNNAGFSIIGAVQETSERDLRETLELMFFGPAALTREILPHMRERKSGAVVQITSVGGVITAPGFGAYCAAKHALEGLSESLAAEVAPFGIRVLIVEPGGFRTQLFASAFRRMPEMREYEVTVGPIRAFIADPAQSQPGDPAKAARAIVNAVRAEKAGLRLPLGGDAVDSIRSKLKAITADVDRTEAIARATAL